MESNLSVVGRPHVRGEVLLDLAILEPGWNGHDASPVTAEALAVAKSLHVVPRSNGGIQVEWHVNGQDFEVSIGPNGVVDGMTVDFPTAQSDESRTLSNLDQSTKVE